MKKDYNTGVPVRRAKKPFETQFFKTNLKIDSVTYSFFSIFENLIKFSSLTRGMRKNYLVELDLFMKELF